MESEQNSEEESFSVTFLVSNDLHSQHVPFDTDAGPNLGGTARRATYLSEQRRKHGNVVVLDVGDAFLGSDYFTFFDGEVEMKLFDALGYEAMAVGNHDFDQGGLSNLLKQSAHSPNTTLLCANLRKKSNFEMVFQPFKLINANGIKIAVVGLFGMDAWNVTPREYKEDLLYENLEEAAVRVCKHLEENSKPDIYVCLSHTGVHRGDRDLAQLGLFDIIFSGHDHGRNIEDWEFINNKRKNGFGGTLLHPGNWGGRAMAKLKIRINKNSRDELTVITKCTDIIDSSYEDDQSVVEFLEYYKDKYMHIAEEHLAVCHHENMTKDHLKNNYRLQASHPLSEYICNALRSFFSPPADIGMVNLGGIRDGMSKGAVTWSTVNRIWPFNDELHLCEIPGKSLRQIAERNANRMMMSQGSGMVYHFSGLEIEYIEDEKKGILVGRMEVNGEVLKSEQTYRVSMTRFLIENDMIEISDTPEYDPHNTHVKNLRDLLILHTRNCQEIGGKGLI